MGERVSYRNRLRVRAAANYLGVSHRSLSDRGWRRRHGVPTMRVGRALVFDPDALDRWLARHAERPLRAHEDPDEGKNGGER